MREILFRAKQEDDINWVYGFYTEACSTKPFDPVIENAKGSYYVNPVTVGQYVGLQDKNGKKIFEGDILKTYSTYIAGGAIVNSEKIVVVHFCNGSFCAGRRSLNSDFFEPDEYIMTKIGNALIVGNVFDNPELLKEEDK